MVRSAISLFLVVLTSVFLSGCCCPALDLSALFGGGQTTLNAPTQTQSQDAAAAKQTAIEAKAAADQALEKANQQQTQIDALKTSIKETNSTSPAGTSSSTVPAADSK